VPEDHRLADAHHAEPAFVIIVQIRTADAPCTDGDFDLPGPCGLGYPVFDAKIVGGVDNDGFHDFLLRRVDDQYRGRISSYASVNLAWAPLLLASPRLLQR
jgi:hypothetical protein